MSSGTERLNRVWREQGEAAIERLCDDIASLDTTTFASMPRAHVLELTRASVRAWQQALETDDPAPLIAFARGAALARAAERTDMAGMVQVLDSIRRPTWAMGALQYRD